MVTVGVFTAPPDAFGFAELLTEYPDAAVEIERVVPTERVVMPYLWVTGVEAEAIASTLTRGEMVEQVEVIHSFGDQTLLRCHCLNSHCDLLDALANLDLTVLAATGTAAGWQLTLRENEPSELSTFHERCRAVGIGLELRDIRELDGGPSATRRGLTDPQYEALRLAYERGYYAEPRETTLEALASELDISRQALASRLRRGYRALIRGAVQPERDI